MKPKLIILPGWSGNEMLWQHQCQHLADIVDPEVIVITDQGDIEKMADAVLARAPEKFILCGHSMGGWVAQHIAIKAPERVSKLILFASWTGASSQDLMSFFKQALQMISDGAREQLLEEGRGYCVRPERKQDKELMRLFKTSQEKFSTPGLINQLKAEINSRSTEDLLSKIQCPTLLVCGRQESFFPLTEQQLMVEKIPNAKMAIIEECGHMLSIEQPQATTSLMRLWIEL